MSQPIETVAAANPPEENLRALDARFYIDEGIFAEERERLFFKTWQYACHTSEIEECGSYVAFDILGQNIFVIRDHDGEIRAYYNICPHRGHKLVEGKGQKRTIVCPYHQWSFSLDGSLRSLRSMRTSVVPDRAAVCLNSVRVDRLLDFVFVNLDPDAVPIAEFWPGVADSIRRTCPDADDYVLSGSAVAVHGVDVAANWKVQIDNYLECQHCRHGHVSFSDMLDINNQRYDLNENSAYNFIPGSGKADNMAYPLDSEHDVMDLHFWYLFPNIGISQFAGPGNLSLFQWMPVDPGRAIRLSINLEVKEPTDPGMRERQEKRMIWGRDVLQPEDISFLPLRSGGNVTAVFRTRLVHRRLGEHRVLRSDDAALSRHLSGSYGTGRAGPDGAVQLDIHSHFAGSIPTMDALVNVAFPVFAIVLSGYLSGRLGVLGGESAAALNRFVYYFALPPLLFIFTARAPITEIFHWPFIFTFVGGTAVTLLIALIANHLFLRNRGLAELSLFSLTAVFANTAYMGIPLFATAFGPEGTLPAIVATLAANTLLIGGAIAALETVQTSNASIHRSVLHVVRTLIRNPLLIAPLLGALVSLSAMPIPKPIGNFLDLMAAAAGPAALFALGLSLFGRELLGDIAEVAWLTAFKLIVHPMVTYVFAVHIFALEPVWAKSAIILSALPVGALVFVIAQQYDTYVQRASSAIVITTALSVLTISALLIWLQAG